jgi:hypothetical protein
MRSGAVSLAKHGKRAQETFWLRPTQTQQSKRDGEIATGKKLWSLSKGYLSALLVVEAPTHLHVCVQSTPHRRLGYYGD